MAAAEFYLYEHLRNDNNAVFYVGKGSGDRCKSKQGRNKWWHSIVAKHGYSIKIKATFNSEELSFLAEQELIDKYKRLNIQLVNVTLGGEGVSGHKFSDESLIRRADAQRGQKRPTVSEKLKCRPKTLEHRAALSIAKKGTKASIETKIKMSKTRQGFVSGMKDKKHSEESKLKIKNSLLALPRKTCPHCGKSNLDSGNAVKLHFDRCKEKS